MRLGGCGVCLTARAEAAAEAARAECGLADCGFDNGEKMAIGSGLIEAEAGR